MHPSEKRSITTITSPKHSCLRDNINFFFLLGDTVLKILLLTQMHFSKVISQHMTVQVMWIIPAWGLTFQLPQQTLIIRIASRGIFTQCSSFQISHLIVTMEFTPFRGYLQLDHPVTCENIKCYSHIQIINESYNFFNNLLPLTL